MKNDFNGLKQVSIYIVIYSIDKHYSFPVIICCNFKLVWTTFEQIWTDSHAFSSMRITKDARINVGHARSSDSSYWIYPYLNLLKNFQIENQKLYKTFFILSRAIQSFIEDWTNFNGD